MNRINNKVNQIRKNYIYESALKEVGILTSKHIDIISKSSISLNYIIDETFTPTKLTEYRLRLILL
jgi:hypothetical protein